MATSHHTTGLPAGLPAADRLQDLHSAYVGFEILAGVADIDSHHVSAVMAFLNEALHQHLEQTRSRQPSSGLRLVDD